VPSGKRSSAITKVTASPKPNRERPVTIDASRASSRNSVLSVFMRHSMITGHNRHPFVGVSFLFATVTREIEGGDAFVIGGTLEHLRVAQRTNGVVIAGAPVLHHAGTRELVIL
jgi:hypothetical protein